MAGRYLLLEFEDPDAAEAYAHNEYMPEQCGFRVVAMFMRPTKFCQCPDKTKQNNKNWAKGKRTGLYLCVNCKKPSIHHQTGILERLKYVFGYNILDIEPETKR